MNPKMPVFKKKVNAFLTSEEGKITKESMLIAGGILAAVAAGSIASKFANASDYTKMSVCESEDSTNCCAEGKDTEASHCYTHGNSADVSEVPDQPVVQHNHHYNHTSHASHSSHGSSGSGGYY